MSDRTIEHDNPRTNSNSSSPAGGMLLSLQNPPVCTSTSQYYMWVAESVHSITPLEQWNLRGGDHMSIIEGVGICVNTKN